MANKPIDMKNLKSVFRLYFKGHGKRMIAHMLGLSKTTVKKYLELFEQSGFTKEDLDLIDEKDLSDYFLNRQKVERNPRLKEVQSYFPYMHKELRKTGVTRHLLWEEYLQKHPDGYKLSQLCEHYNRWNKRVSPTMHIEYKAGDKMLVDYCGKKLSLIDQETGEVTFVEVFVTILGASQLIYVEAAMSQQKADFIQSCERAIHFYGGVPKAIVTDNLKSAVTKSNRYEPKLNRDFLDFAEHYDTVILPTRAYKPKDKALVEGAVRIVYTQIYARLRNDQFTSLSDLNQAIYNLVQQMNERKLSGRSYSRRSFFEEVEAAMLNPLPANHYEMRNHLLVTVLQNGHVLLKEDKHYYSVPYDCIRKKVRISYTATEVRIYYKYRCIAVHKRLKSPYNYTTDPDHLASQHKEYTKWNAEYFLNWARSIDVQVGAFIEAILEKKKHPEQAYRSCIGVLSLKKKVGKDRFVNACILANDCNRFSYGALLDILEKGLDKLPLQQTPSPLPEHENIRGNRYYQSSKSENHE